MSTINDVLTILRNYNDEPEEMERILMCLSKEEQAKLKDLRITLVDQIDCPNKCDILIDFYEMLKITSETPETKIDKPKLNDWKIYLWGKAYRNCKPLVKWCRQAIKDGKLPKRVDENGWLYLYVNDLLPYKGHVLDGINAGSIDLFTVINDDVISGIEIKMLIKQIINDGMPNINPSYLPELKAGRLGYVAAYNKGTEKYLQAVGLGKWLN